MGSLDLSKFNTITIWDFTQDPMKMTLEEIAAAANLDVNNLVRIGRRVYATNSQGPYSQVILKKGKVVGLQYLFDYYDDPKDIDTVDSS